MKKKKKQNNNNNNNMRMNKSKENALIYMHKEYKKWFVSEELQ